MCGVQKAKPEEKASYCHDGKVAFNHRGRTTIAMILYDVRLEDFVYNIIIINQFSNTNLTL